MTDSILRAKVLAEGILIINKQIITSITAAGSVGVTRTGTHNGFAADVYGGYFGTGTPPGNFATFIAAGGAGSWSRTFTLTTGQRGCSIIFSSADGTTVTGYGTCKVYIDSILVADLNLDRQYDGISDGADANTRGPVMLDFFDLGVGSHTIDVISDANGFVVVDSFNVIGTIESSGPIIFCEIPYCDSNGYRSSGAQVGTREISNIYSQMIYDMVLEYRALGFKVGFVPTNDFINLSAGLNGDGTHWNDLNNDLMTTAITTAVKYPKK